VAVRSLPMKLARVDVEALWLRRRGARPGHDWLRAAIVRAAARSLRARSLDASPPPEAIPGGDEAVPPEAGADPGEQL